MIEAQDAMQDIMNRGAGNYEEGEPTRIESTDNNLFYTEREVLKKMKMADNKMKYR